MMVMQTNKRERLMPRRVRASASFLRRRPLLPDQAAQCIAVLAVIDEAVAQGDGLIVRREQLTDARILIVDDQLINVQLLKLMLEQAGFTNLHTTTNPHQVLPLYTELQPDLIVLDLHMPDLDGFAVLDQLRSVIPACRYLPVLVLTADITPEARQRALSMGANDVLTKPFDPTEMLQRLRNLL